MEKILFDMHTHSNYSPDAEDSAEAMCERAAQLGLSYYSLTDHCDCNFWHPVSYYFPDEQDVTDAMMYGAGKYAADSIAEQVKLKEDFEGRLDLLIGVELGQPLQYPEGAEQMACDSRIDFIIGSHHMNKNRDDFYYLDYSNMSAAELDGLLTDHFTQMLDMCRWGKFDVLGHLTYPLRYICGEHGVDVDIMKYEELIRAIFKTLIEKGKGIEINTSGLRQKYGQTFPNYELVKLYRDLGGEILTIGSDAHRTVDLAKGITEGIELAKATGFDRAAIFRNHQPEFIKI